MLAGWFVHEFSTNNIKLRGTLEAGRAESWLSGRCEEGGKTEQNKCNITLHTRFFLFFLHLHLHLQKCFNFIFSSRVLITLVGNIKDWVQQGAFNKYNCNLNAFFTEGLH